MSSNVLRRTVFASLLAAALAVVPAWAAELATVSNAWIRKPPPGVNTAAVYFTVQNAAKNPIVILKVSSPLAPHAMIHETSTVGGQSRMRMKDMVSVPTGGHVSFKPEGLHVMLTGLRKNLEVGDKVPLTLELSHGGSIGFVAVVRPLDAK
jgi:copper(I)-binding protein